MSQHPASPLVPFAIVVPTVYGPMLVNRHDINQTNSLFKTGHAVDHQEIVMLAQVLKNLGANQTVVDVGANIGTFTVPLAHIVGPGGKVHAFEPQRLMYYLLAGSVALNSFSHVYCHNLALGDREDKVEIPQFDYNKPLSFGSIEFTPQQTEQLLQTRGHDPAKVEYVPLTTIDRFEFPKVDLLKIDAEGMERAVLRGSAQTIRRCRPVLYVEFAKGDKLELWQSIKDLDYAVYETGLNFLGIPSELSDKIRVGPPQPPAPPAAAGT